MLPSMAEASPATSMEEQLAAIASFSSALDQEGLDYWLFGGWAVDFCVGSVTRAHDDIDVAAWRNDYDLIRIALTAAGWRHTPTRDDVVGTRYRHGNAEVEVTFLIADEDGRVVIPLPDQPVVWSTQPLGDERRRLLGVSSRTIPLALLRAGKSMPREGRAEAAKDRADLEALSQLDP